KNHRLIAGRRTIIVVSSDPSFVRGGTLNAGLNWITIAFESSAAPVVVASLSPVSAAPSAAATKSARLPRRVGTIGRFGERFPRGAIDNVARVLRGAKIAKLCRGGRRLGTAQRTCLHCRTPGWNRLIQVFVLMLEIHKVGNVEESVAFQSDVDKGR